MKILLVNDGGQLLASMEDLDRYDARKPGDVFALLDLVETLLETARKSRAAVSASLTEA